MKGTYKYRLYPSKDQKAFIEQTLDICRNLYNHALAERRDAWEQEKRSVSYYEQKRLVQAKWNNPHLRRIYSQVLQDVICRVDISFKNFFRRVKNGEKSGYPRFKGKNSYDPFTYPQSGFKIEDWKLRISKP